MLRIIKSHLSTMGFDAIVEALDGESALAKLASEAIDLVITDWAMPTMSGPDLVRAIRSSPTHGKLPVLMITGIPPKEDILPPHQAGGDRGNPHPPPPPHPQHQNPTTPSAGARPPQRPRPTAS